MSATNPEFSDSDHLARRPIVHETLSNELLEQIQAIYRVVGRLLDTTLEQFELEFMRDVYPDQEITAWTNILDAWTSYHENFVDLDVPQVNDEREVLAALIAISTGIDDLEQLGVSFDVGRKLLECYKSQTDP